MLRELGFDVVAYLIWLDEDRDTPVRRLGEDLDSNLDARRGRAAAPRVGCLGQRRSECPSL